MREAMHKKQETGDEKKVPSSQETLKNKGYLRELKKLHIELVKLQE